MYVHTYVHLHRAHSLLWSQLVFNSPLHYTLQCSHTLTSYVHVCTVPATEQAVLLGSIHALWGNVTDCTCCLCPLCDVISPTCVSAADGPDTVQGRAHFHSQTTCGPGGPNTQTHADTYTYYTYIRTCTHNVQTHACAHTYTCTQTHTLTCMLPR